MNLKNKQVVYVDRLNNYVQKDSHLIFEAFEANQKKGVNVYTLIKALEECYKHFSSEPTDPGHPQLLKIVKEALDKKD